MGFTNFPHGITSFGVPVSNGVAPFAGMWDTKVLFVDPNISGSGNGLTPTDAFKTLNEAIAVATNGSTIFLRGKKQRYAWSEYHDTPSGSSTVGPNAKLVMNNVQNSVSIIGAHSGRGAGSDVILGGVDALATPTLTIQASSCNIENIVFGHQVDVQTGASAPVVLVGPSSGIATTFNNCTWDGCAGCDTTWHYHQANDGSLRIDSIENCWIENCVFTEDLVAISLPSVNSVGYNHTIRNNQFKGVAANISACITVGDMSLLAIENNIFGFIKPAVSGGAGKYIYCAGTVTGHVTGNYFANADTALSTSNTLSNLKNGCNFSGTAAQLT